MYDITLIPGDGIGPEIAAAARRVIDMSGVKINWLLEEAGAGQIEKYGNPLPEHVIESIRKTGVALKGPITTPIGSGFRSVNVALRKALDLYANLRPAKNYPNIPSHFTNVDIMVVRENTEDLYAGVEHMVGKDAAESIKIFTREGCRRILQYAFDYAVANDRHKVTAVHKANIMKCTDGMYLEEARKMAENYPKIEFEEMIVDAMCMKLVTTPENYDVLVLPNLYGDIVSDLCAGLVGGLGVAPGANIGKDAAVFEAIHGSAPRRAGQNMANPTALILSGMMMLRYLGEKEAAANIENALIKVAEKGESLTYDLGGTTGTQEFADALIANMA
jgi:isocitrate dehydrogenase (NAD+)